MSNQTTPISSVIDVTYFESISKKYCPTIYEEINAYQPRKGDLPPVELRNFRDLKKPSLEEQKKFYDQEFIKDYFEKKWKTELYNRNIFLRLYELFNQTEEKEQQAVLVKLNMFYAQIIKTDKPYQTLALQLTNFDFLKNEKEVDGWND